MWCDIRKYFGDFKINLAWEHICDYKEYDVYCFTKSYIKPTINDYIFKREPLLKKMLYKFPTHKYLFEMDEEIKSHNMFLKKFDYSLYE